MSDLVSIIIPTYNYGHFICDCVDSVLSQTHRNIQVIVVDDGSTDDTRSRLDHYGAKLVYIYQENRGLSAARNTGLAAAEGQFIQLLDADDMLHSGAIEHRLDLLQQNVDCLWVVAQNYYFSDVPRSTLPGIFRPRWGLHSTNLEARFFQSNIAPPHAFLCRRELFDRVGDFDTSMQACEDYDYWMRALSFGHAPLYSPRGLVYYRRHKDSMSRNLSQQWRYDVIMHKRIVQELNAGRYQQATSDNVRNRLFAALGIMQTLVNADTAAENFSTDLLPLYEKLLSQVRAMINTVGPEAVDLPIVCTLFQISQEQAGCSSASRHESVGVLGELSTLVVGGLTSKQVRDWFLHDYLCNNKANIKTKLDYLRWWWRSGSWVRSLQ